MSACAEFCPPPPISAASRVCGLYAAIRRIPAATLAANASAAFLAHERHESGSSSRHERVFRAPRSGFSGFRAPKRMVDSKFCQRRLRHRTQAPTGAVGGFVTVRRLQILPAEVSSLYAGSNGSRWRFCRCTQASNSASGGFVTRRRHEILENTKANAYKHMRRKKDGYKSDNT